MKTSLLIFAFITSLISLPVLANDCNKFRCRIGETFCGSSQKNLEKAKDSCCARDAE